MAATKDKHTVGDWWNGIKSEFLKIVWPDQETIYKQTLATIVISIITALIIVLCDMVIQHGVDFLVGL